MTDLPPPPKDVLAPVMKQLRKLWRRADQTPIDRWATVSQVSPLQIVLDGETEPITPQTCVKSVTVGQRVYCMENNLRVVVVAAVEP